MSGPRPPQSPSIRMSDSSYPRRLGLNHWCLVSSAIAAVPYLRGRASTAPQDLLRQSVPSSARLSPIARGISSVPETVFDGIETKCRSGSCTCPCSLGRHPLCRTSPSPKGGLSDLLPLVPPPSVGGISDLHGGGLTHLPSARAVVAQHSPLLTLIVGTTCVALVLALNKRNNYYY